MSRIPKARVRNAGREMLNPRHSSDNPSIQEKSVDLESRNVLDCLVERKRGKAFSRASNFQAHFPDAETTDSDSRNLFLRSLTEGKKQNVFSRTSHFQAHFSDGLFVPPDEDIISTSTPFKQAAPFKGDEDYPLSPIVHPLDSNRGRRTTSNSSQK